MIALNCRTIGIDHAINRRIGVPGESRIASGICGRSTHRRTDRKLRQAIERLIGVAVIRPVLPKFAEVVIERAILLDHENDVVDGIE